LARAKSAHALFLGLALMLYACASAQKAPQPQIVATAPAPLMPAQPPSPPEIMAMPELPPQMPEGALPPPLPPEPMAPPAPPPTDAQSLRAAYGAPDFIRKEMNSELWRYDGKNCAVFFFLYREGDQLRIRYTETTPRGRNVAADPQCMQGLSARRMS